MLNLIDPALYTHFSNGGVVPQVHFFFGTILPPYWRIGYKPNPGEEDFWGNRTVDHANLHGTAWFAEGGFDVRMLPYTPSREEYRRYVNGAALTHYLAFKAKSQVGNWEYRTTLSPLYFSNTGEETFVVYDADWCFATRVLSSNNICWWVHVAVSTNFHSPRLLYVSFKAGGFAWGGSQYWGLAYQWDYPDAPAGFTWNGKSYAYSYVYDRYRSPSGMSTEIRIVYTCGDPISADNRKGAQLAQQLLPSLWQWCRSQRARSSAQRFSLASCFTLAPRTIFRPSRERLILYKNKLRELVSLCEPEWDRTSLFGAATENAVENARTFTGNGIAYLLEARELGQTVKDLISLLKTRVSPKALANLWLSYRYGLRLTAMDTQEICAGISNAIHHEEATYKNYAYVRGTAGGGTTHTILYYQGRPEVEYFKIVKALMDWDVLPDFTNVWDMIPFSFVVDWFVDVESLANAVDVRTYTGAMEIVSTLYTHKSVWRPSGQWAGLVGDFSLSRYIRETPSKPHQPVFRLSGSLPSVKNVIDGVSLIIGGK